LGVRKIGHVRASRPLPVGQFEHFVLEKIDTGAAAHTAAALALVGGKSVEAATKLAMAPIKRRVRANHVRLIRG
jgi:hypothetical protein